MVLASLLWEIVPFLKELVMVNIGSTEKSVNMYKFVDVQSGDIEYSFWEDKYEKEVYFGRKTVQEIEVEVEDICVLDNL